MLNERLDFDDPEQKMIMTWIDVSRFIEINFENFQLIFDNFTTLVTIVLYNQLFPNWMIKREIPRKLLTFFKPKFYTVRDMTWNDFVKLYSKPIR